MEETKRMKRTDKAIFRMVSESSGRNVSELRGSLVRLDSGGRARWLRVKAVRCVAD